MSYLISSGPCDPEPGAWTRYRSCVGLATPSRSERPAVLPRLTGHGKRQHQ
ncbi:hypothetical protein [Pseudomonas phage PaBSM-2607-JFK]|nr:hypothetical protein [Pseudomonas phage PaBSM-2607-JFK]